MWLLTCRVPKARASPNQNDCILRASVKIYTVETLQKCILVFLICRQFKADSGSTCCCQFSLEEINIFQAQPFISQILLDKSYVTSLTFIKENDLLLKFCLLSIDFYMRFITFSDTAFLWVGSKLPATLFIRTSKCTDNYFYLFYLPS